METNLDITPRLNIITNFSASGIACYIIPFNRGLGLDN